MSLSLACRSLLYSALFISVTACSQGLPRTMPQMPIKVGEQSLKVEVAANEADRELGLMYRKKLSKNAGMLFIFDDSRLYCMWMKNTDLPLSVAFADESGRIINIEDMQPQTENQHCTQSPARYALEMNLGWFTKQGIRPGAQITLPKQ